MLRFHLGVSHNLPGLLLRLGQLILDGLLNGLLGPGPFLTNLLVGFLQLGLALRLDPFRLSQLGGGLLVQTAVVLLPLGHKPLHWLIQEKIQPASEDSQVHPVQQNLLEINI